MARRREQVQAAEASVGGGDDALTERWYELRNLLDSLRAAEARVAELASRVAQSERPARR